MDLDVFKNQKSYDDYKNSYAAQKQAFDTSKLDQLSKQNVYATQVLTGSTATGDQIGYNTAKQHLANNGIDVSMLPEDVGSAAKYIQASRQAQYSQNPLMALANLAVKQDANASTAKAANGDIVTSPNARSDAIMQGAAFNALGGAQQPLPQAAPQAPAPWRNPDAPQIPISPQVTSGALQPLQSNVANAAPQAAANPTPTQTTQSGFVPPPIDPTKNMAWNKAKFDQKFDQYKESFAGSRQKEAGTKQGAADVSNLQNANQADGLIGRITQNLEAMKKLNYSVPQTGFIPASAKAYASQALHANPILGNLGLDTSGNANASYDQWKKIDLQQSLSEMQNFVKLAPGTRLSQTLEGIISKASGIDVNASPESRAAQIDNALGEIKNMNISAHNLVNEDQGKPTQGYAPIPVTLPTAPDTVKQATESADPYQKARDAIAAGAPKLQVQKRLLEKGLDPRKL